MPDIMEVAASIKKWASEHDLLGHDMIAQEEQNEDALGLIETAFQSQATTTALANKKISLVVANPEEEKITVYLSRKPTRNDISTLPKEIDKYKIEYKKASLPSSKYQRKAKQPQKEPYHIHKRQYYTCGSSISPAAIPVTGTLGCLLRDKHGNLYGLSNNHVAGGCNYLEPQYPIMAPGMGDIAPNGFDPFTIGHFVRSGPFLHGSPSNIDIRPNLDVSIFRIKDPETVSSMQQHHYDTPTAIGGLPDNNRVYKVGRTTGLTVGIAKGCEAGAVAVHVKVPDLFDSPVFFFQPLVIESEKAPFSQVGDSGSLICCDSGGQRQAYGLLFASSADGHLTFAMPMRPILQTFDLELVGNHNAGS